jgi:outer membrane usher protein
MPQWALASGPGAPSLVPTPIANTSSVAAPPADPTSASGAAAAPGDDQVLLLEVDVNGQPIGKVGEFTLRRGKLMARASELRDLGFQVPDSQPPNSTSLIPLSELPGFTFILDQQKQELHVTVGDSGLLPTQLHPLSSGPHEEHRVIESGTGVTINYDVVNTVAGGQAGVTGDMDLRAFSPWGVVSSGWLAYGGANATGPATNTAIRLDSSFTYADVNSLRRYSLGDFITGGLGWTRSVHLGGVQIRSDFSTRPDLVTFPMPSIRGSAAVPSTVDVLVDGSRVVSSQIAAGPFQTPQLPVMSGAGTISMTVTNALGQQVTVTQPFYASSALLAPRLQTFAAQAGLVRLKWGAVSNAYGKMAGTALYRRGLSPKLTIEGSAEGTPGAFVVGGGGVAQIGNLGVINFAASGTSGAGSTGAQLSLGAQHIGRVFSIGAASIVATRNYRDVAAMNGDGVRRKQLSAFASLSSRRFGAAGVAYGGVDQDNARTPVLVDVLRAEHSKVVSANYSLQFHHVSVYASEFQDISRTGGGSGVQMGLTIPFGRRSSVAVSATSDGNAQFQAQQSASQIGEWGYDGYLSAGKSNHAFGEVHHKSRAGLFTAGIDTNAGQTTLRLEGQGALSLVDRSMFVSNPIYDSFAIVDTGPMAHVHVLQENREVGRTNSSGRLLVPDMRSFDLNHITIAPTDIPPDAIVNDASREIRPQDRSGVVVRFPVKISHGALLRLVDEAGAPLAVGSIAQLRATGQTVPVGYDGEAYVENLGSYNAVSVERTDGRRCSVSFGYQPVPDEIPTIGPLTCREEKQ